MEKIKSWFSKDTKTGRMVRTFFQTLLAVMTFMVFVVSSPQFADFLANAGIVVQAGTIATIAAGLSRATNLLDKLMKWLMED